MKNAIAIPASGPTGTKVSICIIPAAKEDLLALLRRMDKVKELVKEFGDLCLAIECSWEAWFGHTDAEEIENVPYSGIVTPCNFDIMTEEGSESVDYVYARVSDDSVYFYANPKHSDGDCRAIESIEIHRAQIENFLKV